MKKILYIQYTNPVAYPPLEHSSKIFADKGWEVLFLGLHTLGIGAMKFPTHANITLHNLFHSSPGLLQKLHYLLFAFWIFAWSLRFRPNLIYASDYLSTPIALILSYIPTFKVVYHEHDTPARKNEGIFLRFCFWTRRKLARRALVCILPNETRVERFEEEMNNNCRVMCVWNCPSKEEVRSSRPPENGNEFTIIYHGSINSSRLPMTVIDALSILPDSVRLKIVGYESPGSPGYLDQMRNTAIELGLSERVEFLDAVPRRDLFDLCGSCDIGLTFMPMESRDMNLQFMVGASNKAFDYLSCGMPLIVSDIPEWKEMFVDSKYGLACDPGDPENIAEVIRWFLKNPQDMRSMGERGRQRIIDEWNYENQLEEVYELLKK